jgi:L,D-peptidoglycan transpeptidase YkuD (ErfK/YbiS/YcfS/YnhG family)
MVINLNRCRKSGTETNHRPQRWTVRRAPGNTAHHGLLAIAGRVYPCALGRSGISVFKREGDGATPAGKLRLLGGYCRRDRLPLLGCLAGLKAIRCDDGWCDDPGDPAYNRPVQLPFTASHERMMRTDNLYDICVVLDWNVFPRARFRGSAIFLHIAGPGHASTEGCVAVTPALIRHLLAWKRRGTTLRIMS